MGAVGDCHPGHRAAEQPALPVVSLFAFIAGATLLWARVCLTGVSYRRRFGSERLFHGEETDLYVEIVNAKPLPLAWLHIADEFPRALTVTPARTTTSHRPGRQRLTNLVSLRWYERVTCRYRVHGAARGAWTFGPAELSSGDIFGFALRRATAPDLDVLLVYPRMVPLTALGLPADRPFGEYRALRRLAEDPLRMNGARAYAPGDTLRTIHWKATARRGELHTKTFDAAAAQPLALFLNVNTFEQIWEGVDSDLLEYAISATASIARWAWERGQPVGLYANSVAQPGALAGPGAAGRPPGPVDAHPRGPGARRCPRQRVHRGSAAPGCPAASLRHDDRRRQRHHGRSAAPHAAPPA